MTDNYSQDNSRYDVVRLNREEAVRLLRESWAKVRNIRDEQFPNYAHQMAIIEKHRDLKLDELVIVN